MPPPSPPHRHQSSLKGILDFSTGLPLRTDERVEGERKFYRILDHFEAGEENSTPQYSRPRLVRFTYEYALSEESRDNILRAFFNAVELPINGQEEGELEELRSNFFGFADHLLDNFFLPCKNGKFRVPASCLC